MELNENNTAIQIAHEINKLKEWFRFQYNYKEQKYRRLIALNKMDDDGVDSKTKLNDLYIEAEEKRSQIQTLEAKLRDTKPQEFAEYNEYVEKCKEQIKNVYNYEEVANAVNQESEQEGTQKEY